MSAGREWKSIIAERLHLMGLDKSSKSLLFGDERPASQVRAEGERRAREREMRKPREANSLLAWLRARLRR